MLKKLFILTIAVLFLGSTVFSQTSAGEFLARGIEHLKNERFVEAARDFNRAVELDSQMPEAYFWRAQTQYDDRKILADYDRAIALKPDFKEAYFKRGVKKSLTDSKGALADFNKALEIDRNYADAYFNRALVYLLDQKVKLALADYSKVIELQPTASNYYVRGLTYHDNGDAVRAIADLTKSIELDPDYYWSYMIRARAYRKIGKIKLAQTDERRAREIGPPKVD